MKKYFKVISIFSIIILLTGCVKYNYNVEITEDKKMNMELIIAVSSALENMGESDEDSDENEETEKKLKEAGWKVEEYKDDTYTGKKYTKTIENIDEVSTDKESDLDLNELIEGNESKYIFYKRVENGKEIYKAVFKSDTSQINQTDTQDEKDGKEVNQIKSIDDGETLTEGNEKVLGEGEVVDKVTGSLNESEIDGQTEFNVVKSETDGEDGSVVVSDDGSLTTGSLYDGDTDTDSESGSLFDDEQSEALAKQMMSTMDLKVVVTAPNIISNNATSVDGNKMTWDLTKVDEKSNLEFEFAIPIKNQIPIVPIAIGAGCGLLLIIIVVAVAAGKKKKANAIPNAPVADTSSQPVETPVEQPAAPVVETPVEAAPEPAVVETPVEQPATPVVETPVEVVPEPAVNPEPAVTPEPTVQPVETIQETTPDTTVQQ